MCYSLRLALTQMIYQKCCSTTTKQLILAFFDSESVFIVALSNDLSKDSHSELLEEEL